MSQQAPPQNRHLARGRGLIGEFKDFINKGNVIDLAVAVVLGAAFTRIVNAIVEGVFSPLLAAIVGETNFSEFGFDVGDSRVSIGTVIDALINFVAVALVLFLIVKAYNRMRDKAEETSAGPTEIEILADIRDELRRRPTP